MTAVNKIFDSETQKNIDSWLTGDYDPTVKEEIRRLKQQAPEQLRDAFYTHLSFGTGGLRGIMGTGTNRMNVYTVRAATQGLANYLHKKGLKGRSLLIGYDCRNNSRLFAEETAKVLAANDFHVFLYQELRPVALISFGVLHKKCVAGVMITASHNPPIYNGYKVYWSHGGQVVAPHDQGIVDEAAAITSPDLVKSVPLPHPRVEEVGEEIDSAYLAAIRPYALFPRENHQHGGQLHIVYTSLHGGGITMVPRALKEWGFGHLTIVEAQATVDGNFPTVRSPNPEELETLKMGIETLEKVQADLLLATDPDVDRLAVVVRHEGKSIRLDGNMAACLVLEHLCSCLKERHLVPPKAVCVKSIVTSELFRAIAQRHDIQCLDVLTGFKYIGEKIGQWDEEALSGVTSHHFLFGGEESYGALRGTHARDKDAVSYATLLCELALVQKRKGRTLVDALYALYHKYGVYREQLLSLSFEGKEGQKTMQTLMQKLRAHPPKTLGDQPIVRMQDYESRETIYVESGRKEPLMLPHSDVLEFVLGDQTKIVIRPSGTEPKIKIYAAGYERHFFENVQAIERAIHSCETRLTATLNLIKQMLL